MKSELVPTNGGTPIAVVKDITVVGRGDDCDIQIDDPSLSKRHAVLVRTEGLLLVRDLISTNGTKVNGQRVSWAALLPNDRLTLGRFKARIYLGPDHTLSPSENDALRAGGPVARVDSIDPPVQPEFMKPMSSPAPGLVPSSPMFQTVGSGPGAGSTDPDAASPDEFLIDDEDFVLDLED